jgi:type I restriction enzyme S subunit
VTQTSQWPRTRLRFVAKLNPGSTLDLPVDPEAAVTFLPMEAIGTSGIIDCSVKRSMREVASGFTYFERNDVVVAKITPCFENGKGAWLNTLDTPFGFGTTELIVLRPGAKIDGRFLYWVTQGRDFRSTGERSMTGSAGQQRISNEFVACFPLAVPPLSTQKYLCDALENKLSDIDRFIANKRLLMHLFEEQKVAAINRAVTRGINPTVRLKASGIDWLGEVPTHWRVQRIKHLVRSVDHRSVSGNEPLLSMRMYHGLVRYDEHYERAPQVATLVGYKLVQPGQIVINRMQAGNGLIFASSLSGIVSPDYSVFDVTGEVLPEFAATRFRSQTARTKFRQESKGLGTGSSGFLRLYDDRLASIHIAMPPQDEQEKILQYLRGSLAQIDAAIQTAARELDLIREFRAALISAVVNGDLDVRCFAEKVEVSFA